MRAPPWPARRRAALPVDRRRPAPARRGADDRVATGCGDASRRRAVGQKVAPLIERLRDCSINDGDDPQELEALRDAILAATEATP